MASPLKIPEQYRNGLAKLLSLDDKNVQELLRGLEKSSSNIYIKDITTNVIAEIGNIPPDNLRDIISVIHSLYLIRSEAGVPTSEFIEDLLKGMDTSEFEELSIPNDTRESFKQHITQLLSIDAFALTSKANGLLFEFERTLADGRIMTDIRPVFGEQSDIAPKAAIIIHTLRLGYFEGEQTKEFYVALDSTDIKELIDGLKRAQSKAESLESILEKAGVTCLKAK
jgi:hypothetical protein